MENKVYPAGPLLEFINAAPPHVQLLSIKITEMVAAISHNSMRMEAYASNHDGIDRETVEDVALGSMLVSITSHAAACAAVAGKRFSPSEFGRFAERVARELVPDFAEVGKEIAANRAANAATPKE